MAPEQQRQPRILACVLCQQRKKKCDRKSPCSFCIKAKIPCIPSTPAPKRNRRKPTKELLARLERCEELLKRCNCVQKSLMYDNFVAGSESQSSSPTDSNSSPPPESDKMSSTSDQRQRETLYH
ncbi:transcription factor [Fusarium heterosporum]|uniref:Transcription factor n=1 Tax=Fusarium heterosporum TaxID=42747 RepID=A0A8H5T648_FUSHE|nr:transcription factor [Fusarium heterosporum]